MRPHAESFIDLSGKTINFSEWIETVERKYVDHKHLFSRQQIVDTVDVVETMGEGCTSIDGNPCLSQGLAMADCLSDLLVDSDTLCAAIVYSFARYTKTDLESLSSAFGPLVLNLVKGARDMHVLDSSIHNGVRAQESTANLRQMILAMVKDVRIVLIKMAERIVDLYCAEKLTEESRVRLAEQTLSIYAPLSNRLGLSSLKWQLEDLAFKIMDSKAYEVISKKLAKTRVERLADNKQIKTMLSKKLKTKVPRFTINSRVKHIYSIAQKMQRKALPFDEIYDVSAIRIIVKQVSECYTVLAEVHNGWGYVDAEYDDYIASPKDNGYQSIHTAIIDNDQKPVEVQIRTQAMHDLAEGGQAAHWAYKENDARYADSYSEKIRVLHNLMAWQRDLSNVNDVALDLSKLFDDRVYAFTPAGDVKDLPMGATVLDFAYAIHTDIGHRCRGAKINGKMVQLKKALATGDTVEVLTSKEAAPSRDWLSQTERYLTTAKARAKVHQWFKRKDHARFEMEGRPLFDKVVKTLRLQSTDLSGLCEIARVKTIPALCRELGSGRLSQIALINAYKRDHLGQTPVADNKSIRSDSVVNNRYPSLTVEGMPNVMTHFARCCMPVNGEQVVGYVTAGHGVSVHRVHCHNLTRLLAKKPDRLVTVEWGADESVYCADIIIESDDAKAIIANVTQLLLSLGVTLLKLSYNQKQVRSNLTISVEVTGMDQLAEVISKLKTIEGVTHATRAII